VRPFQGRLFGQFDARPDAASTAVVSYAFSMREFGGAPAAIGQTLSLNRKPYTVIGVLAPGVRYMSAADVYLLLEPQVAANYRTMQSRSSHTSLYAVGRLKPGVDVTSARSGVVAAMGAVRSLASLVFGVTLRDPATLGTVAALLTVVTLLACYMSARSATRIDPLEVLRSE
jgi:putative ABC transport system permease protein